jgi:hypothetical protein
MKKFYLLFGGLSFFIFSDIYSQNVGIGTSTPQRKLHIHSTTVYSGLILTNEASGETANDGMHLGIQYQEDAPGNRYGLILSKEEVPLRIGTNNDFAQMVLLPSGNLGLGITNPAFKLEFSGSMRMQGAGTTAKRIVFRNDNNTADMGSIGHLNDSVISIADNNPVQSSRIYFDVENAKMGIGAIPTDNDGKVLVTYNSTTGNPHITAKESVLGDYARFEFANTGATRVWHIAGQNVAGSGTTNRENDILNIWNSSRGDIMSFRGDGRVGILTTAPATGYALSVNGRIICTELRVQLTASWPDYVFADNYKLRKLYDVADYIKTNKHLPGIPSAAEIERDGISVGDMQKRMMEKIEELTLYIIQQQKEIDALKIQVEKKGQ